MMLAGILSRFVNRATSRSLRLAAFRHIQPRPPRTDFPQQLYIHVPFCEKLCSFCSFYRVLFEEDLAARYFACLRDEIRMSRDLGFRFDSLYVGGGTPTVLPRELEQTCLLVQDIWGIREISVETDPSHLTEPVLDRLQSAGVARLSVGVQSFQDGSLARLGRSGENGTGRKLMRRLQRVQGRFPTLNVDMIFNIPCQTVESLQEDIDRVLDVGAEQVTFYPLMEKGPTPSTPLQRMPGSPAGARREEQLYFLIARGLSGKYRPSTAWCFSHNGSDIDEYIVTHDEYAGLGAGAFGYMEGLFSANTFSIPRYIECLEAGRLPPRIGRSLTTVERVRYTFLMRLFSGRLEMGHLERLYGPSAASLLGTLNVLLRASGDVDRVDGELRLTPRGRYLGVAMMREFFIAVGAFRDACRVFFEGEQEIAS
jgi:coproporphyrinogen III oxidase-like Fe-S oxidoreductase